MRIMFALLATAMLVSACTSGDNTTEPPAVTNAPTTTASMAVQVSPAPKQGRLVTNPVEWDPCFQVPDSIIEHLGFDPKTRERADWIDIEYTFLGCKFQRRSTTFGIDSLDGILTVMSGSISLDQVKTKETTEYPVTIASRDGVRWDDNEYCTVAMTGPDGVLYVTVDSSGSLSGWAGCDHLEEQSKTVESTLPN